MSYEGTMSELEYVKLVVTTAAVIAYEGDTKALKNDGIGVEIAEDLVKAAERLVDCAIHRTNSRR
jgi:hypothetical protein